MITSKNNDFIKHVKSLHQKKFRDMYNEYFVEGIKLVNEAIDEKREIYKIIICDDIFKNEFNNRNYEIEHVNENVFKFISDTDTPQGIMAIIKMTKNDDNFEDVIFALDNIQDPGNLGTIIRTLDCAGIKTLLLSNGTVDLYNPKVIRSTMGAIFRVNCIENVDLVSKLSELKNKEYKVVVTALDAKISHYELDFKDKYIIVIGNESKGVSKNVQDLADIKVKIPMLGRTESLNASVAASLIAYEFVREKQSKKF